MRYFRFIYSSSYFGILGYLVFFARRRRNHHFNYEVNFIPIKNTIDTFLTMRTNDKFEVFNFYVNLFGNVLLFIPLSLILITVFKVKKLKYVILIGIILSVFIEFVQYAFQIGLADIDDVILNSIGTIVGYSLYKLFNHLNFPSFLKHTD